MADTIDFTAPGRLDVLLRTRLLVQANSGGGKSRALRSLLEQTHGQVLQIVLDPEGEFATLREHFPFVLAGKDADVAVHPKTARTLCRRLFEEGASAVVDLFDLALTERREFVKLFLTELMALPRTLWRPALIVLDEAHLFAPERGSGEAQSTDSVIALCTQGRKRGFCAVLATQRISKLHKDAAAELLNKLIGRTGLDVDMKRAGDELGMDRERRLALRDLAPGEFVAFGPMFGPGVHALRSAPVRTTHPDASTGSALPVPRPSANVQAIIARLGDIPQIAAKEQQDLASLEQQVRRLEGELRRARAGKAAADTTDVERAVEAARRESETRAAQRERAVRSVVTAAVTNIRLVGDQLQALLTDVPAEPVAPNPVSRTSSKPQTVAKPVTVAPGGSTVSGPQQRMLDALARCEAIGLIAPAYGHVAVWSGQSPKSSGFEKNLSTLATAGYVVRQPGRHLSLTDAGRARAASVAEPPSLEELHDAWMAFVSGPQQRMLRVLIAHHPNRVSYTDLAHASEQSPTSSGFEKNLSTLCAIGLLKREPGKVVAAGALLFPEGLP